MILLMLIWHRHNTKHKRAQLGWQGSAMGACFRLKHAKNRYNAHIAVYKDSVEEIKSSEDVKKAVRRVGYSQLCNIELKEIINFINVLCGAFLFAKMRSIDKATIRPFAGLTMSAINAD